MVALDTNLLVYAHRTDAPLHEVARRSVEQVANGPLWSLPWPCVHEFVGVVTHPRIFKVPTTMATALDVVRRLVGRANVVMLAEVPGYLDVLEKVLAGARIQGAAVHDARIAALCLLHGVSELWSADRDFSRFATLRVRNPLVS